MERSWCWNRCCSWWVGIWNRRWSKFSWWTLKKRRPSSNIDAPRQEKDKYQILSGVFNGKTTGSPITNSYSKWRYEAQIIIMVLQDPSHTDYAASIKYNGFEDYRGGGHFRKNYYSYCCSWRNTYSCFRKIGIKIATHISSCWYESSIWKYWEDIKIKIKKIFQY